MTDAPGPRPFLTARWRWLAMLNWAVDPALLASLVPRGTELDRWDGRCYVSVVGFRFLDTRVRGVPIPFHRHFTEVNLRFYVRRRDVDGGWRRGVVFVREIVPRAAIALVARARYGEPYVALPMQHRTDVREGAGGAVEYAWRLRGAWHRLTMEARGVPVRPEAGSEAAFITEHYWGYTARPGGRTMEYRVAHPPWQVWPAAAASLAGDLAPLYGAPLAEAIAVSPDSAFLADGSAVAVYPGTAIAGLAR